LYFWLTEDGSIAFVEGNEVIDNHFVNESVDAEDDSVDSRFVELLPMEDSFNEIWVFGEGCDC
jgi:hypothetical protein